MGSFRFHRLIDRVFRGTNNGLSFGEKMSNNQRLIITFWRIIHLRWVLAIKARDLFKDHQQWGNCYQSATARIKNEGSHSSSTIIVRPQDNGRPQARVGVIGETKITQ